MKNAVKKAMSVMFLLALTITLNTGVAEIIPQDDGGTIAPQHDELPVLSIYT